MSETPTGLPGDPAARETVERMIRVDHAGEYGATRIYAGQLAVLRGAPGSDAVREMAAQEDVHLAAFADMVADRRVRPTALLPLWHVAGFALGALTAALGERAAMACTVAVEEAIDAHYAGQIAALGDNEAPLRASIAKFREDELHHRDTALAHGARETPAYRLLTGAIKAGCRLAIKVSERI
jgi:ubiquinone biosynthesis monooxygenase Coq7